MFQLLLTLKLAGSCDNREAVRICNVPRLQKHAKKMVVDQVLSQEAIVLHSLLRRCRPRP